MSQGLPSPVAGAALAAPQQPAQQPAQQQAPAQPAQQQAPQQPAQQQAPAQPGITPEAIAAYQQQLQGYVQQLQQSHTQDMQLRLALTRAGVHHDGYLDYAVGQYNALAPSTRPKPHEWVPQFQAQYPAFFGPPAAAPAPPGGPPPGVPGNPSLPAAAPPGAPPPGWPSPAAPAGWPPQAPPQQTWPGYPPPQQPAPPQGPVWNAAAQRWEGPPPQQAPTWQPAPAALPMQLPAPPWQPAPAPPAAPQGWPQMFRPNPDTGATSGPGAGAIDPPLTEALILQMDPTTMARRWTEVEAFMRSRGKR